MEINKVNGPLLQFIRRQRGFRQLDIARLLDVSELAISRWENNRRTPPPEVLERLAALLGVDVADIVTKTEGKHAAPTR